MGKKVLPKKYLKFYLDLKYPKMATSEQGCEVACVLVLKSMCPFTSQKCLSVPRIALLFSRSDLLFPGIALLFSRSALLFPGIALLFSRSALLFPRSAFLFLENALLFSRIAF